MNVQHVDIVAGDDRTIIFTAKDHTQAVKDLTGGTLTWRVARCLSDSPEIDKTGTIVSAAAGTFSVALTDTDTEDLCGDYIHQGKVTISGVTTAVVQGRFRVRKQIEA